MLIAFVLCGTLAAGSLSVLSQLAWDLLAPASTARPMACPALEALKAPPNECRLISFNPQLNPGKRVVSESERFVISLHFGSVFPFGAQNFPTALGSERPLTPLELSAVEYERRNPADVSFQGSDLHFLPEILRGRAEIVDELAKKTVTEAYLCCCDTGTITSKCSVRSADNAAIYSFWADLAFVTSGYSLKKKFRE